jgi:hypothetical protein
MFSFIVNGIKASPVAEFIVVGAHDELTVVTNPPIWILPVIGTACATIAHPAKAAAMIHLKLPLKLRMICSFENLNSVTFSVAPVFPD